jgi:Leucine-rich repeat (LRR) protein
LTRLSITDCSLTDAGVAALGAKPALNVLDLSGTQITSAAFASLGRYGVLEMLFLSRTLVDDSCIDAVAGMPNLQYISLANSKVTPAGTARLLSLRPDILLTDEAF